MLSMISELHVMLAGRIRKRILDRLITGLPLLGARQRRHGGCWVYLSAVTKLILITEVASLIAIVPLDAVAQTTIKVAATYWKPPCGMSSEMSVSQATPITVGRLEIQQGAGTPVTVMLGSAPQSVTLSGSGTLSARLILETARVRLISGALQHTPVVVVLDPPAYLGGVETFSTRKTSSDDNGNVNALAILERAADAAEQANGAPLPQVYARVFSAPGSAPTMTHFDAPATINIVAELGRDDRWEPTTLIHEYGHVLMENVAPGGPSGGAWATDKSYPKMPDLAWTEGFGIAFAAVVTTPEWAGVLHYRCGPPYMTLVTPTRPPLAPQDARYAQYSPTRVAAATYHLVDYLGGSLSGLKRLVDAMKVYRRDGHYAWTARDLRDLAVQAFEKSGTDHAEIDQIFYMQGIGWEQYYSVGIDGSEDFGETADIEILLSVTGPAGFTCRPSVDIYQSTATWLDGMRGVTYRPMIAQGGLTYSKNDDCYLRSGDGIVGVPRPTGKGWRHGSDGVDIPFPYLQGLAHWSGPYTVTAKYVCAREAGVGRNNRFRCPATFTVQLRTLNRWLLVNVPTLVASIPVMLVKDVDIPIVTFTANGDCKAIGGTDCGF